MKKWVILLLSAVAMAGISQAQEEKGVVYRFDTLGKTKSVKIIGLPVVFSSPETDFGFGGGGQVFLLKQSNVYNARLSNVLFSAIYTLRNQFLLDVKPQIYVSKGDYFLDMSYQFKIFPNLFWGIGSSTAEEAEEDYDMTSNELRVAFLKRLPPSLNFGFEYVFENHNVTEVAEGGILASGSVLGSEKAVISGVGVIFNLDSRDNIASPRSGYLLQMNGRFSSEIFGSTTAFNTYIFDFRAYRPLGKKSLLALQGFSEGNYGDVPFQGKAWFGGGDRARGYFRGRFIDDHQVVLQAEYRLRFHRRWSAAGFALMGGVADLPGNLFDDIKPGFGGGLRFQLVKDQDTLLRVDIGFGEDGNSGFYFGVNEAF